MKYVVSANNNSIAWCAESESGHVSCRYLDLNDSIARFNNERLYFDTAIAWHKSFSVYSDERFVTDDEAEMLMLTLCARRALGGSS